VSLPTAGRVGAGAAEVEIGLRGDAGRQFAGLGGAKDINRAIGQALCFGGVKGHCLVMQGQAVAIDGGE